CVVRSRGADDTGQRYERYPVAPLTPFRATVLRSNASEFAVCRPLVGHVARASEQQRDSDHRFTDKGLPQSG
ncbi:MAG: hypothetical protein M3003_12000, partial [Candidatus Dormibacteraeota bacterium]|nr:hypothetical protein [Candidatus Dormibacteraeota bacterium]